MFTGTAWAEIVDHSPKCRERRGAISPDIRAVSFLLSGCQHLHWRFVGVDNPLSQDGFSQRINQRLQLHAGLSYPLRQRGTRDRQACAAKDPFLPIQRQVISELGHHHVSQEACRRNALVDHLGRYRRLDQRFALPTGPLAAHMLFDGEHTGRVIQLLADVLADALELATASTLGVLGLVIDHRARKLRRQWCTLGLLARFCCNRLWSKRVQLRFDGLKVGIDQVVEQAALRWADLLTALGSCLGLVRTLRRVADTVMSLTGTIKKSTGARSTLAAPSSFFG